MSLCDDKQADIIDVFNTTSRYLDNILYINNMSQCTRFPTMWYVRPAKPQISLRIRAV